MALRTNSKIVKQRILDYIMSDSDYIQERAEYDGIVLDTESPAAVCSYMWKIFQLEKPYKTDYMIRRGISEYTVFQDWAAGLALGGLFLYYYNISAVDLLGDILEETETERNKFTEDQAEEMLTRLIFRAIQENRQEEKS